MGINRLNANTQLIYETCKIFIYFRCIAFHPEGQCLFSGAQDSMRVYGWEPVRCYDSFSLAWGKVADIAISSSQLVSDKYYSCNKLLVGYFYFLGNLKMSQK